MANFASQSIGMEGIINARELGGFRTRDGHTVKRGLLLRGGSLNKATEEDMERMRYIYGVSHIFDFRTAREVFHAPDIMIPCCRYFQLSTIDPDTEKVGENVLPYHAYSDLENFLLQNASDPMVQKVASKLYTSMVFNEFTQLQYASFLQIVAHQTDGAVYWHCSQGKDRTGLGAAFLLCALGADRETIMEDYLISGEYYKPLVDSLSEKIIANGGGEEELKVINTFMGVSELYFTQMLDMIDRKWGSLENYLSDALLISPEDTDALRSRLLE